MGEYVIPKYLYHITDKDHVDNIMKTGLIPGNGENCIMVNEDLQNRLFLCSGQDIPYWSILLGKNVIVKVSTLSIERGSISRSDYGKYCEWFTSEPIDCSKIVQYPIFIPLVNAMSDLCEDYIYALSDVVVKITRFVRSTDMSSDVQLRLIHDASSILKVMRNRLKFDYLNEQYIVSKINEMEDDGEYTMCDKYCVTERFGKLQLWEQLIFYDFNNPYLCNLEETCREIYDFINKSFKWVYKVKAGGYTG